MAAIEHCWVFNAGVLSRSSDVYGTLLTLDATTPANGDAMVGDATYLVIAQCRFRVASFTNKAQWKIVHGSTDFAESELTIEHYSSSYSRGVCKGYATIFTQPSTPEDILLQVRCVSSSQVDLEETTILAVRLDEDLTQNTDWWTATDDDIAVPIGLTTTPAAFASQTLTTDANASYLVIGYVLTEIDSVTVSYIWELDVAGTIQAKDEYEGEDVAEFRDTLLISTFTEGGSGQSRTFELDGSSEGGNKQNHAYSRIIVFKLTGVFEDFGIFQNTGNVSDTTTLTEIANVDITLSASQNVMLLSCATYADHGAEDKYSYSRIQESGTSVVSLTPGLAGQCVSYDPRDNMMFGFVTFHGSQSGTLDYDNDVASNSDTASGVWNNRNLIAWGMELPAGVAAIPNKIYQTPQAINRAGTY